jgi:hypothetical protein
MHYDPKEQTLGFEFVFDADNAGNATETIVAIQGSLESKGRTLAYFSTTDFACESDGNRFSSVAANSLQRVSCTATHRLTPRSRELFRAPGTIVLTATFEGRFVSGYPLQFCIAGTEGFWKDFLASSEKASRRILNPRDCS